jgi:hypothetical protein
MDGILLAKTKDVAWWVVLKDNRLSPPSTAFSVQSPATKKLLFEGDYQPPVIYIDIYYGILSLPSANET